ncbi:DUF4232 domain-containing protein [Streptomyces sp. 4N509B]|uniref:DUF4232 domain-containing protein n=1 Tax=Streptomyces sp. 4N509B TaxID=3457413 RepID=UPI003FD3014B
MKSPTDPPDRHEPPDEWSRPGEPGELTDAFRADPDLRLDPPPGTYAAVRRRAAGRRRRRTAAVTAAVAACVLGGTALAVATLPGRDGSAGDTPPAAAPPAPGHEPTSDAPPGEQDRSPDGTDGTGGSDGETVEATPAEPTATTPPAEETGTPSCTTPQLSLAAGPANSGAGSLYLTLEFTNTGEDSCALLGYPGVSLVTAAPEDGDEAGDTQIGSAATRGEERGEATLLELAPDATATADLRIARAENYDDATCEPVPAEGFLVYPPNERASLFLPYDNLTGCAAPEVELLAVTVVYE